MYTQSFKNYKSKTNVISFPNKDSIVQMEKLRERNETTNENICTRAAATKKAGSDSCFDSLLLLGALLGIADSESINSGIFPLIAGVLLTL